MRNLKMSLVLAMALLGIPTGISASEADVPMEAPAGDARVVARAGGVVLEFDGGPAEALHRFLNAPALSRQNDRVKKGVGVRCVSDPRALLPSRAHRCVIGIPSGSKKIGGEAARHGILSAWDRTPEPGRMSLNISADAGGFSTRTFCSPAHQ